MGKKTFLLTKNYTSNLRFSYRFQKALKFIIYLCLTCSYFLLFVRFPYREPKVQHYNISIIIIIELSRQPHIVVATPGRLADHIESCKTFTLSRIQFLVLDEADRLLGGHFDQQIKTIFGELPKKRQNLFFSATITDTLEKLNRIISNKGK